VKVLDFLFPRRCVGCGRIGSYVCSCCRCAVRIIEQAEAICPICKKPAVGGATHPRCRTRYSLDGLSSFFHYDSVVRQAMKTLKYRLVTDLAREFTSLIPPSALNNVTMQQCNNCVFIPIPLHPARLRERGFNQAEVLGRLIAEKIKLSPRTDTLTRMRKTTPQVHMKKREDRLKNMEKVFSVNSGAMKQCNNVILFDDVFTTGATLRSAANALKRAGAKFVWGMTMAR